MNSSLLKNIWLLCLVLGTNSVITHLAYAYQTSLEELLTKIESQLRAFTFSEQDALRAKALATCSSTIEVLSQSAVGYALVLDQELPSLEALLKNQHPDLEQLIAFEERLRLITPGSHQAFIDQLQAHLSEYRRTYATNAETLKMARSGIATLRTTPPGKKLSESEQQNTSAAFAALYNVAIDPRILRRLQTAISMPNVQTQYRTRSLELQGQKSFQFPIQFSSCTDRTRIQTDGTVSVSLVPRFGSSNQSIPLAMHVEGLGVFNATADRSPANVSATFTVMATGLQPMQLHPLSIERKLPDVNAQVEADLQDVRLEGHLSRSRILHTILGRAIERKLEEQEPLLSRKIELTLSQRANEEGEKLSYKINHLLTQSIWSRLESIRFTPDISLSSAPTYITSQSLYAYPDQLGALTHPPAVPPDIKEQLDWTTHTHESAINNICRKVRGFQLDEATMRGVWQVQLKLTAPEWETPRSAVIPAVITFAIAEPIRIEFREHRLNVHLRLHTASTTSKPSSLSPIATTFSYSLAKKDDRFHIVRSPFTLPAHLNDMDAQAWQKVLTRFFPETLEPIPKFRPSMWENFVSLRYLNAQEGWLSVGLRSVTPEANSSSSLGSEKGTQP